MLKYYKLYGLKECEMLFEIYSNKLLLNLFKMKMFQVEIDFMESYRMEPFL